MQASDLSRFGAEGTVLAGYHYDLNAMTIHGRSRFPGTWEGAPSSLIRDSKSSRASACQFTWLSNRHVVVPSATSMQAFMSGREMGTKCL